jgi:hypothetical protein
MTRRAILYVETGPAEGRDADWHFWYDGVHIPEILKYVPGFRAATRYERLTGASPDGDQAGYCTVYEIESDDPKASFDDLIGAVQSGKLTMSDSSGGRAKMTLWVERTPRATGS